MKHVCSEWCGNSSEAIAHVSFKKKKIWVSAQYTFIIVLLDVTVYSEEAEEVIFSSAMVSN